MGMFFCATCHKEMKFNEKGFRSEKGYVICKKCKADELRKNISGINRNPNKE